MIFYRKIALDTRVIVAGPAHCEAVHERVQECRIVNNDRGDEEAVVGLADAEVQPHAVVVELVHAAPALVAVLRARLHLDLAVRAVVLPPLVRSYRGSERRSYEGRDHDEGQRD